VDYFTKWIEAEVIATITAVEVRNIITCFGIPRTMVFDNMLQFDTTKVIDYLSALDCHARFTTVAHP